MTTINVVTKNGQTEDVVAELVGEWFAVHRDLSDFDSGWTLTHVPTGRLCLRSIATQAAAVDLGRRFLELGDAFWANPHNWHMGGKAPKEVRAIITQWGRDQGVGGE